MSTYDLLKTTITESFSCVMQLGIAEYKGMFMDDIAAHWVDVEQVRKEFEAAQSDAELDWFTFAIETKLFDNLLHQYDGSTKEDIVTYLKVLMSDGLYPEKRLSQAEVELLRYDVLCALRDFAQTGESEGWMSVEEIIQRIRGKRSRWEVLEPYHFLDHFQEFITPGNRFIEKSGKRPFEIGRLRVTERGIGYLETWMKKWYDKTYPSG